LDQYVESDVAEEVTLTLLMAPGLCAVSVRPRRIVRDISWLRLPFVSVVYGCLNLPLASHTRKLSLIV
jgi:hypothetical protein